ncbi:hypothetical protein JC221_099 [Yersinia phage JC221]|nr:hypothetical protein JC221_099 [Yersinia phage JC221]
MKFEKPNDSISGVEIAFGPKNLSDFLPAMYDIPKQFFDSRNPWNRWAANMFYNGLKEWPVAKQGIHFKHAAMHIKVIMTSWEPKHEHKLAGCGYLASLWLEESNLKGI